MLHKLHHSPATRIEREARLCARTPNTPDGAHEAMTSLAEMKKNNDLMNARALFDNPSMRKDYEFIEGEKNLDRAIFQALLLSNALPSGAYRDIKRTEMKFYDPFGLEGKSNIDIGRMLTRSMTREFLEQIDPSLTTPPDEERLGLLYKDAIIRAKTEWDRDGTITEDVVIRAPLERYKVLRNTLDGALEKEGIRIPGTESVSAVLGNSTLTRREYVALFSMVWNDVLSVNLVADQARGGGVDALRTLINDPNMNAPAVATVQRYTDVALEELGPNEALEGLGISITPELRNAYINAISGRSNLLPPPPPPRGRGRKGRRYAAAVPGKPPDILTTEEGASTWERFPERAYPFLSKNLAQTPNNIAFLDSLKYHFVMSPPEKGALPPPALSIEDTRATLVAISQSLVESESVIYNTQNERTDLKEKLSLTDTVQKKLGEAWDIMKDFKNDPLRSGTLWALAAVSAVAAYKFIRGKHKGWVRWLATAGLVGAGIGFFQERTTGTAWWDGLWNKIDEKLSGEKAKDPEQQTLPSYWSKELGVNGTQEKVILSLLAEHKVGPVLDWYGNMRTWKMNGSRRGEQPKTPFSIDAKLGRYFGSATRDQRSEAIFGVLDKFMANRGERVRTEFPDYAATLRQNDDAALGYAYMRERYVEQSYFTQVVENMGPVAGVSLGPLLVNWNNPSYQPQILAIQRMHPSIYLKLVEIRADYERQVQDKPSAYWDMSTVFLLEADPEILRRMGREGTEAASVLGEFYRDVRDSVTTPFSAPPEDLATRERLLKPAERELFAYFNGATLKEVMTAHPDSETLIRNDWDAFIQRLPLDAQAKAHLNEHLDAYLPANSSAVAGDLLNNLEFKKYQLLVAISKDATRLTPAALQPLKDGTDVTWNATFDSIIDWALPDGWMYPRVNNFTDLSTLFDSEATQPGGVAGYAVWQRMFPHWETSDFEKLHAKTSQYQEVMQRLKTNRGILPITPDQVTEAEIQLSRRMSNHTLEAMLRRHGDLLFTPDRVDKRGVTQTEIVNLEEYYDEIFELTMGQSAASILALPIPVASSGPASSASSGPASSASSGPASAASAGPAPAASSGPASAASSGPASSASSGPAASGASSGPASSASSGPASGASSGPASSASSGPAAAGSSGPASGVSGGPASSASSGPSSSSSAPSSSASGGPAAGVSTGPSSSSSAPSSAASSGPSSAAGSSPSASGSAGPSTPSSAPASSSSTGPASTPGSTPSPSGTSRPSSSTSAGPGSTPSGAPGSSSSAGPTSRPTATPSSTPSRGPAEAPIPTSVPQLLNTINSSENLVNGRKVEIELNNIKRVISFSSNELRINNDKFEFKAEAAGTFRVATFEKIGSGLDVNNKKGLSMKATVNIPILGKQGDEGVLPADQVDSILNALITTGSYSGELPSKRKIQINRK